MNILKVAKKLKLKKKDLQLYGNDKAKVIKQCDNQKGKLILVTAINPTPKGEGKTTVSIGLADALSIKRKKVCLALREASLGPVFGAKGGAIGGGKSKIVPANEINLHFTGDFHAITSANNLLCAMIDNHIYHGNQLKIDKICFNRCIDINDRSLRDFQYYIKDKKVDSSFNITASSEIMAIMCVSRNLQELEQNLGDIIIGYTKKQESIFAKQLKVEKAMISLLKDSLKPNLVQTLIGTPAFVHLGPFANIAHGCNSIISTKLALSCADYVVTEAGFGADLGAEKFLDFKCRNNAIKPNVVVIVATVRALKYHGTEKVGKELEFGIKNLFKHIDNLTKIFNVDVVVAINKFSDDTQEELQYLKQRIETEKGIETAIVDVWTQSGTGATNLADMVIKHCQQKPKDLHFAYNINDSIEKKVNDICKKVYGAKKVIFEDKAKDDIQQIIKIGKADLPIIMAKTPSSLSGDSKLLNVPKNFEITIKELKLCNGAKFIVALANNILLMPGLSKQPRAENFIEEDI